MYTESEARKLVIDAGLLLKDNKLVARTWGNISAKISENEFIITPSGKAYEDLTEEDLVKVNIDDLSYQEGNKPSSEKGLHASVYKLRENCNFIIHTHQNYATALSVKGESYPFAPCAKYALPGTKSLMKSVAKCVEENKDSDVFIFERHGALSIGSDYLDCFEKIKELEKRAKEEYEKIMVNADKEWKEKPFLDDYAQMFGNKGIPLKNEDEEAISLVREKNALASQIPGSKPMNFFDCLIQNFVYKKKYSKLKNK